MGGQHRCHLGGQEGFGHVAIWRRQAADRGHYLSKNRTWESWVSVETSDISVSAEGGGLGGELGSANGEFCMLGDH